MEGILLFPVSARFSKLDAQTAPEIPVRGNEHHSSVSCRDWDISLSKQVAEIGERLHVAREEAGQGLPNLHAQVWIEVVKRFAVCVLMRDHLAGDPLVAGGDFGTGPGDIGGDASAQAMAVARC